MNNYKETFALGAAEDYATEAETDLSAFKFMKELKNQLNQLFQNGKVINIYPIPPVNQVPIDILVKK